MYKEHFGLSDTPFSLAPDPRYFYMSENHREAIAHLLYGITNEGGFILLTGEIGTGKTTICRRLLENIPGDADIALILNPKLSSEELLAVICDELGIRYPAHTGSVKAFVDLINSYLLDAHSKGRKTVLIIEEAQNLSPGVLEQIRLLTNLETDRQKLIQIIMVGQPELRDLLSKPEMRQLAQRITARYHLGPLRKKELPAYVAHRLGVAGVRTPLFPSFLMRRIFSLTGGIPRLINLLCDRALLGAYAQGKTEVDRVVLNNAAREIFGIANVPSFRKHRFLSAAAAIAICGAVFFFSGTYLTRALKQKEVVKTGLPAKPDRPARTPLDWAPGGSEDSERAAYEALFREWGIPFDPGTAACSQVRKYGLECMTGQGSLGILSRLNRPAILKLFDKKGARYYALLKKLDGNSAVFSIGRNSVNADIAEIESRWLGSYTVFWETPPHYTGNIRPGTRGNEVQWLENRLASLQGREPRPSKALEYDQTLRNQVIRFQEDNGLTPDGVAGPKTLILLTPGSGDQGPKLKEIRREMK